MALCALAGAMFLWSGTFIAMKVILGSLHPVLMVFIRMAASALILLPLMPGWIRRTPYVPGQWRIIGLLVLCEPCLYFLFEGYALRYTTASQAGLVTALLPLPVGLAAWALLGERLPGRVWLGFCLSVGGVVFLTLAGKSTESAPHAPLGNALEFMAMLMACVYTLCVRKLTGYQPFFITAMQAWAGTVFFAALMILFDVPLPDALPPTPVLGALVFLCFSTIVAYSFFNIGVARLNAGQAAAWMNLIPGLTLLLGITLLDERLNLVQAVALVPIIAGIVLSQGGKGKAAPAQPES